MKDKTYIAKYLPTLRFLAETADSMRRSISGRKAFLIPHSSFLISLAFFILHSSFFISCSDDYTMENAEIETEQALSTAAGFSVKPTNESSRLTYDNLSTTFSNGDSVGCIICTMSSTTDDSGNTTYAYEFVANSLWTYIENSVAFVIKKYWQVSSDDSNTTTLTLVTPEENSSSYLISYSGAKTLINSSVNLYLFFYYPFIDPEETTLQNVPSYTTTNDDETTTTTYLCGPPSAYTDDNNATLYSYPTTTEKNSLDLTPYSWRQWPLFVNSCSSTISNSMGDWMDARYLYGVNNTTTGNINIQFKHRTAAICINAAENISDVAIVLGESTTTTDTTGEEEQGQQAESMVKRKADEGATEGGSGGSGDTDDTDSTDDTESSTTETTTTTPDPIKIGQLIDLASGKLRDFDSSSTSTPDQYAYLTQSSDTLYPYKIDSQNYRFYLPAQDNWAGRLIYSYDSDTQTTTDDNGNTTTTDTLRALSLKTLGNGTLVANTKYDVNIPNGPNYTSKVYYIYFGKSSTNTQSDDKFFTVACRNSSSSYSTQDNTSTDGYGLHKKGIVTDVDTFTYVLKLQHSSGGGEYVGFEVPTTYGSTMNLVIYARPYTSAPSLYLHQLPTNFDFSTDVTTTSSGSFTSSNNTTYTATTITAKAATDDEGNAIYVYFETLEAGYKYMLYRNSGDSHAYLIVLTNNTSIL